MKRRPHRAKHRTETAAQVEAAYFLPIEQMGIRMECDGTLGQSLGHAS